MTEGALGSIPSKRPMLLAETEKGRVETGAIREADKSLVEFMADARREMVRRADILATKEEGGGGSESR